jgi:hypothetical protein
MGDIRRRHEDPPAIARLGWRYHHLGIPHGSRRRGERHLQQLGIHVCGFETSPYGVVNVNRRRAGVIMLGPPLAARALTLDILAGSGVNGG